MNLRTTLALLFTTISTTCVAQTDTNVLGVGEWSEPVVTAPGRGPALRGRLLVYDDQGKSAANHARVYLELQQVFVDLMWQVAIFYDISGTSSSNQCLRFEMQDENGRTVGVPGQDGLIWGTLPKPVWLTLPGDSTMRLRADIYTLGSSRKPEGLEVFVPGGDWIIPKNPTNDFYLSATFTSSENGPCPLEQCFVWKGTLHLPKVKIKTKK